MNSEAWPALACKNAHTCTHEGVRPTHLVRCRASARDKASKLLCSASSPKDSCRLAGRAGAGTAYTPATPHILASLLEPSPRFELLLCLATRRGPYFVPLSGISQEGPCFVLMHMGRAPQAPPIPLRA